MVTDVLAIHLSREFEWKRPFIEIAFEREGIPFRVLEDAGDGGLFIARSKRKTTIGYRAQCARDLYEVAGRIFAEEYPEIALRWTENGVTYHHSTKTLHLDGLDVANIPAAKSLRARAKPQEIEPKMLRSQTVFRAAMDHIRAGKSKDEFLRAVLKGNDKRQVKNANRAWDKAESTVREWLVGPIHRGCVALALVLAEKHKLPVRSWDRLRQQGFTSADFPEWLGYEPPKVSKRAAEDLLFYVTWAVIQCVDPAKLVMAYSVPAKHLGKRRGDVHAADRMLRDAGLLYVADTGAPRGNGLRGRSRKIVLPEARTSSKLRDDLPAWWSPPLPRDTFGGLAQLGKRDIATPPPRETPRAA